MIVRAGLVVAAFGAFLLAGCGQKEEDKKITIEFNVKKEEPQKPEPPPAETKMAPAPLPEKPPAPPPPEKPEKITAAPPSKPSPEKPAKKPSAEPVAKPKEPPAPEPRMEAKAPPPPERVPKIEPKPEARPAPRVNANLPDDFLNKEVYVRTTLHALKHKLIWQNFLSGTPIVPGTPATITVVKGGAAIVTINGVAYKFAFSSRKDEPKPALMLSKFFSPARPDKIYSAADREAARGPDARPGMSKTAILGLYGVPFALGSGENQTGMLTLDEILRDDQWVYLVSKKEKVTVHFKQGRVTEIQQPQKKG